MAIAFRLPARALLIACALTSAIASAQVSPSLEENRLYPPKSHDAARDKAPAAKSTQFPDASRVPPALQASSSGGRVLSEAVALYHARQYADTIRKAEALAAASTNAFERSFAYQLAASAAADSGDQDKALLDFRQAIDANGLGNDAHYQVMYNLAVLQFQTQHPADAVATMDRLMTETHLRTPQYQRLKAGALVQLHRPAEAATIFEQLYAADPTDNKALMNAVAAHRQANEPAKATALLASAQAAGRLQDAAQYRSLYVGYINDHQPKQALAVIEQGVSKGVIQPSPELANAYALIAQDAYASGDAAGAIAMLRKAVPMAADGEAALNLARLLWNEKRPAEARAAARQALEKGVRNKDDAMRLSGQTGK